VATAHTFATAWAERTGARVPVRRRSRLYRLAAPEAAATTPVDDRIELRLAP
jgi:hypothetical protein